jgi:hypothetical protein
MDGMKTSGAQRSAPWRRGQLKSTNEPTPIESRLDHGRLTASSRFFARQRPWLSHTSQNTSGGVDPKPRPGSAGSVVQEPQQGTPAGIAGARSCCHSASRPGWRLVSGGNRLNRRRVLALFGCGQQHERWVIYRRQVDEDQAPTAHYGSAGRSLPIHRRWASRLSLSSASARRK